MIYLFTLVLMRLLSFLWVIFKWVTMLTVLIGGIASLSATSILGLGWIIESSQDLVERFLGIEYLVWVAANWSTMAYLIAFVILLKASSNLKDIHTKSRENAIFIGALASYLNISFDSPIKHSLVKQGFWKTARNLLPQKLFEGVLGAQIEDLYDVYPIRDGSKASLEDDITSILKGTESSNCKLYF